MAGVILAPLVKWTADKLYSSLFLQSSSSLVESPSSAEQELDKLGRTMMRIHATLDDAEEREITQKSELLRLRELKEVAYDAEDVVDECEYAVLRAKVEPQQQANISPTGSSHHKVSDDCNSDPPKVFISDKLICRVKEIRERFEEITNEWARIELREKDGKRQRVHKWKPLETTSFFDEATTFGREDEKRKIAEWLLGDDEPNGCKVSVLPIVGMAGIGKTTLAQMVYNDTKISKHFDFKGWVCVSDDFDIANLTRKIMMTLLPKSNIDKSKSLEELYMTLKAWLKGKKFFLVLDDVWNQRLELWDSLKNPLSGFGVGKVIVTTRNEPVARIMQTTPPIYLSVLSFNNCWLLFSKIAFQGCSDNIDYDLLQIGESIVKKCQGLPLAVKVLASILRFENDEEIWSNVLDSELWELDSGKDNILPALKLSYDHMPIELRPCFMYLSLFPKDYRLHKSIIVQHWMSHGFLRPKRKELEEEVGNAYFNELLQRSMIQYENSSSSKEIFIMHDLIHDLAQYVAKDEHRLITTPELICIPGTVRHLSIHLKDKFEKLNLKPLHESMHLRTLILHCDDEFSTGDLLMSLRRLRTLVLSTNETIELPRSIGELKHLRYLGVYGVESIPESVYRLYHLQTLNSGSNIKISSSIGDLINLRHLDRYYLDDMPCEVGRLTKLQTLEVFTVGVKSCHCKLRQLKDLANLKGSLTVRGLDTVRWFDVTPSEAYLKTKRGIEKLELIWSNRSGRLEGDDHEKLAQQVLECLRPNPNLRRFFIEGYPGASFPMWFLDTSFSKLQELTLWDCSCLSVPTFGQLPALKYLELTDMKRVKHVGRELLFSLNPAVAVAGGVVEDAKRPRCYFPSLEKLIFEGMDEWEEWQGLEDCDFPRLRQLDLSNCPKLKMLPSISSLRQLAVHRCRKLRQLPPLSCLDLLEIHRCPVLRSLPFLPCLRQLDIHRCHKLRRLPSLPCLALLRIGSCPELGSLPSLPSLTKLKLKREWDPMLLHGIGRNLPRLRSLKIKHFRGNSLDLLNNVQQSTMHGLEELVITKCSTLRSVLGLGSLGAVRHLVIHDCSELQIPPDEHLPPKLIRPRCVEIDDQSPGARVWFQDQLLNITNIQMDSKNWLEEKEGEQMLDYESQESYEEEEDDDDEIQEISNDDEIEGEDDCTAS